MSDVTHIFSRINSGDCHAAEELLPLVYDELRKLAAAKFARENPGKTLQATALVHDAYLRLVDVDQPQQWEGRGHFFAAAAEAMRRILIEVARHKQSQKAGAGLNRIDLNFAAISLTAPVEDLLDLDDALSRLTAENLEAGELAKLRLFAGLTVEEAAENLGISRRTGFRQWTYARAFLQAELDPGRHDSPQL